MNHNVNLDPATTSAVRPTWSLVVVLVLMVAGEIAAEVLRQVVVRPPTLSDIAYEDCWGFCSSKVASVTRDGCWCQAPAGGAER